MLLDSEKPECLFSIFESIFELITTDPNGLILYHNTFVTDHIIHHDNVAAIIQDGRTRWKTENENNNTLKRQGYNLDHNFGHGKNNLATILATLNLIAFLFHTVLAITSEVYQKIRKKLGLEKNSLSMSAHCFTIFCFQVGTSSWNL